MRPLRFGALPKLLRELVYFQGISLFIFAGISIQYGQTDLYLKFFHMRTDHLFLKVMMITGFLL